MFDIGFWEMAFIGVIALVIVGPEKLPRVARTLGLWIGKARRMVNEVKRDIKNEIDEDELKELKSIRQDIVSTTGEIKTAVDDAAVQEAGKDIKKVFEEAKTDTLQTGEVSKSDEVDLKANDPIKIKAESGTGVAKKVTPKKAVSKKVAPRKATSKKASAKKAVSRKKTAAKAVSKKVTAKNAVKRTAS